MKRSRVDETTLSTVWFDMQRTCYDMRYAVERSAQNYLMAGLHDLSMGIWDAEGRTVAVPVGIAVHFLAGGFAVKSIAEKFKGDLHPGDVILTNDPYHGGLCCHLPDWGFFRPIFYKDELVFWTLVRGHQQDTGGSFPGGYFPNAYDIHAEGICIPPVKVFERGKPDNKVLELLWNNVRFPDGARIDNYAMIAATKLCEQRLVKLLDRYSKPTVLTCVDEMITRTEKALRKEISKIPAGSYQGESATDDDGTEFDVPVPVKVTIKVQDGEMVLDFSDNWPQRKGFINCIYPTTYANAVAAAILVVGPELADYHNEGTTRCIKVIAPEGTVVNATYPATVGSSPNSLGVNIMEAVLQALSKAIPERAIAAAGRNRIDFAFGLDPRTGKNYVRASFNCCGSLGAVEGYDGYTGAILMQGRGAISRGNVEEEEVRFPWRIQRYEFAQDLMGHGKYRGGCGVEYEEVNLGVGVGLSTGAADGDRTNAPGASGGQPAPLCRSELQRGNERIEVRSHRVTWSHQNDLLAKLSSGGGGVGDPAERDPLKVLQDVRNEVVSLDTARDVYKVHINRETLTIDKAKTEELRKKSSDSVSA